MIINITNHITRSPETLFSQLMAGELFYWVGSHGKEPVKMKLGPGQGFIYLNNVRSFREAGIPMQHDVDDWAVIRIIGELTLTKQL